MDPESHLENEGQDGFTDEAARCRRLAESLTDRQTIESLTALAQEYDERAQCGSN